MNSISTSPDLVSTPEGLAHLCAQLRASLWLALDTEFLRERTYYPQLCLLQVAGESRAACVDVLALPTIEPLLELLQRTAVTKVVHAGRQDLEILHHVYGALPGPVFDTQLAAALVLGVDQIGYAALVDQLLGVRLDKAHTRADWSRRPLSDAELTYALEDVQYLGALYLGLEQQLRAAGRLHWLDSAFAELLKPETYTIDAWQAWRRVKESQRMRGIELVVLRHIAAWREGEAIACNLPRKWVLSDEMAVELARRRPQKPEDLSKVRGLEARLISRYGAVLLELVAQACATPKAQWLASEQRRALTVNEEALVDMLAATVKLQAIEAGVTPALLANRAQLEEMVRRGDAGVQLEGWRDSVAGEALRRVFAGKAQLALRAGRAVLLDVHSGQDSVGEPSAEASGKLPHPL